MTQSTLVDEAQYDLSMQTYAIGLQTARFGTVSNFLSVVPQIQALSSSVWKIHGRP